MSQFMKLWQDFKAKMNEEDETEDEIRQAFRDYDRNGDGYITKDEMLQARKTDGGRIASRQSLVVSGSSESRSTHEMVLLALHRGTSN